MVFQKPNPFPTMSIYDNVVAGLRCTGGATGAALDELVERSPARGRLWDEVKDRLDEPGAGAVRRPAAAAVHRPRARRRARGAAHGRTVLGARPDLHRGDRGPDRSELKQRYTIVIVTHNMQQAARVSDRTAFFNLAGTGKPGKLVEVDVTEKMFTNPIKKATEDYITGRFG